jgi:hypothetical protein
MCGLEAYEENQAGSVYVELKMYMPNEFFDNVTKLIFRDTGLLKKPESFIFTYHVQNIHKNTFLYEPNI